MGKKQSLRSVIEGSTTTIMTISGTDNKAYQTCGDEHFVSKKHPMNIPGISVSKVEPLDSFYLKTGSLTSPGKDFEGGETFSHIQPRIAYQVLAAVVISATHFAVGALYGFPGVTLPELTDPNTDDLFLNTYDAANFGSMADLGATFGCLLGSVMLVRLGQRSAMLIGLPVAGAAYIGLGLSHNAEMLQAMRFLVGMSGSYLLPGGNMYMLEVSHKRLRGLLFGLVTTTRQCGILLVYAIGGLGLGWRTLSFICGALMFLPILGLFFLPSSPRWLVTQGRTDEALQALIFYRGERYNSKLELQEITEEVGQNAKQKNGFLCQARMLLEPATLRPMALIIFISLLCNFSGFTVLTPYVVTILQAANVNIDAYISATLIGAVRVAGTLVHLIVVDRMGRKPLLVTAYILCAICMTTLGAHFYIQDNFEDVGHLGWIALAALVPFVFFTGIGQPVTYILQGELLPTSSRGAGVSVINTIIFLGSFAAIRTYSLLSAAIGQHGAFWFYGAVCLCIGLVGCVLPETRGRSLEEITDMMHKKDEKTLQEGNEEGFKKG